MKSLSFPAGFQPIRRDQLRQEHEHDSYRRRQKPTEPSSCPDCGAVFHCGRWQWSTAPSTTSNDVVCPACQRIRDHFPAGFVHVSGEFIAEHRAEILNLINHHAAKAKAEHPLARVIEIIDQSDGVLLTTTDIHLARDLGEALRHAYHGELDFYYNDAEQLLRVHWRR